MPQPRRLSKQPTAPPPVAAQTAPPVQPPSKKGPGVAAAAAAAAATALAVQTPSVPGRDAVQTAAKTLLDAIDALFRQRRATFMDYVKQTAVQQMPGAPGDRVDTLAAAEMTREIEFQRKARLRLETDLPRALALPDPHARAMAVGKIMEREKRFLRQREDAAAQRIVAALETDLVREQSPQGAYWQLSPLVREHCIRCLGMAEKFWPWAVLDAYPLPLHPNCACRLLTLDEAASQGLIDPSQIPDEQDAIRRAKGIMSEATRLQEQLAPEELAELIADLDRRVIEEASGRQALRWGKGLMKGGEFMPKRGGDRGKLSAAQLAKLHELSTPISPATAAHVGRGKTVALHGDEVRVPEADAWTAQSKGHAYSSPPGGTNIYRDGILIDEDHPDLGGPGLLQPGESPGGARYGDVPESQRLRRTAPTPPSAPIPDYTGINLTLSKKKAGGSTGAQFATDAQGERWLLKTYGGNQDRVATELLANAVYRQLGVPAAEAGTFKFEGKDGATQTALAYPTLEGEPRKITSPSVELGDHFMTDALVANWDFVGLTDDNVLWDGNRPIRIDQGGTFQYRAQGESKPYGPVPTEAWSMLSPKGQGFGKVDVTESEMRNQAHTIGAAMTPDVIDKLVDAAPFSDTQMREEIRTNMKARVQWMRDFADGEEKLPVPLEGSSARQALSKAQETLDVYPEDHQALDVFLGDAKAREAIQSSLRAQKAGEKVSADAKQTVSALDALLRDSRTGEDVVAYRPIDPESYGDLEALPGKNLTERGFLNATTERGAARSAPGMLRLTVPAGSRMLYTPSVVADAHDLDPDLQLLFGRGTRMRVLSTEKTGGRVLVNAIVLP